VTNEDAEAWAADQHELDHRGGYFFSATQFWFTALAPS
jgi:hypothetical protein